VFPCRPARRRFFVDRTRRQAERAKKYRPRVRFQYPPHTSVHTKAIELLTCGPTSRRIVDRLVKKDWLHRQACKKRLVTDVCPRSSLSFVYSLRPKIDATLGFEFCQKKKDATPLDVGPTEHALLKKKKEQQPVVTVATSMWLNFIISPALWFGCPILELQLFWDGGTTLLFLHACNH
jgi:hypothetical protein